MSTWLDQMHEAQDVLRHANRALNTIASALSFVGLDKIADQIGYAAQDVSTANELVSKGITANLNQGMAVAREGNKALLDAIVAGAFSRDHSETE